LAGKRMRRVLLQKLLAFPQSRFQVVFSLIEPGQIQKGVGRALAGGEQERFSFLVAVCLGECLSEPVERPPVRENPLALAKAGFVRHPAGFPARVPAAYCVSRPRAVTSPTLPLL